jgi:WD40 repeat protein
VTSVAEAIPVASPVLTECPYVGLTHFTEADAPFFFGRESERRILAGNLMASRLTLVYGPSGVGKSSLLRAGLVRDLRVAAEAAVEAKRMPESIAVVFASWRDEPLVSLGELLASRVNELLGPLAPAPVPPTGRLDELLERWSAQLDAQAGRLERATGVRQPRHVELLIVLDQFEEYFLYHPDEAGAGTFAGEFPRAVNRRGLRSNFLVSIREDAYTLLDRFEDEIPNLFGNNIRIEHLDRVAAEEAIRGPIRRFIELRGSDHAAPRRVEGELVDAVLEQVRTGSLVLGQAGGGVVESEGSEDDLRVETPFLQLVMERLWHEEYEARSGVLSLRTLERLGGAERIVHAHLDNAVAALERDAGEGAQEVAARVFGRLVTPSGTKIAYLGSDLAKLENVPPERLSPVLTALEKVRILRSVAPPAGEKEPRYEIFHDVLAPAVLDWRARWLQAREERRLSAEKAEAEKEAARERAVATRFKLVAGLAGLLAAGAGILAFLTIWQQETVRTATQRAKVSELLNRMDAMLAKDPAQAIPLAENAVRTERSAARKALAVEGLREALRASHLVAELHAGGGPVRAATFSRNGRRLLTVAGRNVDIWRASDGEHLLRRSAPTAVLAAALSPNGKRLVTGDASGRVLLWRLSSPTPDALGRAAAAVLRVSFSGDGRRVISASSDRRVVIWPTSGDGTPVVFALPGTPTDAALSPNGRVVLATVSERGTAGLWDARTRRRLHVLGGRRLGGPTDEFFSPSPLRAAAFSPDGTLVVTARDNGVASVWNVKTGRRVAFRQMSGAVTSIGFDRSEGRSLRVVTGAADGSAEVWRVSTGKTLVSLRGHADQVSSVAFSPNGRWIATASADQTVAVWNAATGRMQAVLLGHGDAVEAAAFSSDGRWIATASDDGTARLWRLPAQAPDRVLRPRDFGGDIDEAAFSGDGDRVFVVGGGPAVLADVDGPRRRRFDRDAPFAALGAGGARVITASPSHFASWDARTGKRLAYKRTRVLRKPLASADGSRVVLETSKGVSLWDTFRNKPAPPLQMKRRDDFDAIGFSSDGKYLLTTYGDDVAVWDATSRSRVGRTFKIPLAGQLRLSPDGKTVVGVVRSGATTGASSVTRSGTTTKAWSTRTGKQLFVLPSRTEVSVIRFSPQGGLIVTAGDENAARVWDAHTGKRLATLRGHTGRIRDAAFSRDDRLVVTASADGTARIWAADTGEFREEVRLGWGGEASGASFDPYGRRVLVNGSDGTATIYTCRLCGDVDELLKLARTREPRTSEVRAR